MPLPSPTSDRLMRIDQARDLVFQGRSTGMQPGVSPWIAQSWQRCLDIGERPDLEGAVHGRGSHLAQHNLNVLRQFSPLEK